MACPTLHLTSPYMRDGRGSLHGKKCVRDIQYLLNNHSKNARDGDKPFGDFFKGQIDGVYGALTASGVRHAKNMLGFPKGAINGQAGPILYDYLTGKKKIPLDYSKRRQARLKTDLTFRDQALRLARQEIGTQEHPRGSNYNKYGSWYHLNGVPWCAIFVSWCFSHAGRRFRYSYCPAILSDARMGYRGLRLVAVPQAGDIVLFRFGAYPTGHTGIFESGSPSSFNSIEGNTGSLSDDNGGEVMRRARSGSQVAGFVRVR